MAFSTGILVLTKPLSLLTKHIPILLSDVSHNIHKTLYVHLAPGVLNYQNQQSTPPALSPVLVPCSQEVKLFVNGFYTQAASQCSGLDIRILLSNITNTSNATLKPQNLIKHYDIMLSDCPTEEAHPFLLDYISHNFPLEKNETKATAVISVLQDVNEEISTESPNIDEGMCCIYDHVVIGGTFDRLHTGHKILLGQACFISSRKLTIGVTDGQMNAKKTLCELITPINERMYNLLEYLQDTKPSLEYNVVPITDPFGPSIVEADMTCILVSQETVKGGQAVNTKRKEKGLSELAIDVIELVEDVNHSPEEESKISSSSFRRRLLGTLLFPPDEKVHRSKRLPANPYLIGLTGGIASGKSSICRRLEKLGAGVVDCDKLGHEAYLPGTETLAKIVATFGKNVLSEDGTINRKELGSIVFSDKNKLLELNAIVWPAIADLARKQIQDLHSQGKKIIILDAAVLLDAGWDNMVHEIWTSIIPKDEAVKRIMERNHLSEEESLKRINSQMTNQERVDRSHVILSTLWQYDVTQKQVELAWALLQKRIVEFSHL